MTMTYSTLAKTTNPRLLSDPLYKQHEVRDRRFSKEAKGFVHLCGTSCAGSAALSGANMEEGYK